MGMDGFCRYAESEEAMRFEYTVVDYHGVFLFHRKEP